MKLIALDPSGNFHEGKGTTGICVMEDGNVQRLTDIKATDFDCVEDYWNEIGDFTLNEQPDHVVIEGYKLYNHKGMAAKTQANSDLETPQLLGYIKMVCWKNVIPYTIQYASQVKTRWSDEVLVHSKYLENRNGKLYFNGNVTNTHKRDSLRHALHFSKYGKV